MITTNKIKRQLIEDFNELFSNKRKFYAGVSLREEAYSKTLKFIESLYTNASKCDHYCQISTDGRIEASTQHRELKEVKPDRFYSSDGQSYVAGLECPVGMLKKKLGDKIYLEILNILERRNIIKRSSKYYHDEETDSEDENNKSFCKIICLTDIGACLLGLIENVVEFMDHFIVQPVKNLFNKALKHSKTLRTGERMPPTKEELEELNEMIFGYS